MHSKSLALISLALASPAFSAPSQNGSNLPYSTWFATSFLSKGQPINRHYVASVLHEGIQKAATLNKNESLLAYTSEAVSSLVSPNGTLIGWDPTFYSLDDLRIGNNILYFWDSEGRKEEKYKIAASALRQQINLWPRTPSGVSLLTEILYG